MNHVPVELMNIMEGIHTTHVPYKGTVPSLGAVVSGKMHFQLSNLIASSALGTRGTRRLPAMPDLPVIAEAGMPGFQASALFGLFMPERDSHDDSLRLGKMLAEQFAIPSVIENINIRSIQREFPSSDG